MATVYLARDLRHDRNVALKLLRPELAAIIGAERFLAEIRTTANLQHPHILPLFDSGGVDGLLYYVMPFIEGETLRDRLTREKQLPIADAVRITTEVASALDYAHRQGVIHRDIKPENILLHDGSALVADFGIALAASRAGGARMTETGMSLGTPHYMSPEQAMGERELTARSDVYALGCVLYEMLLGEPPFTGPTAQAIVAKVMTERPAPLASRRDRVPPQVEEAVLTALEKLPADRFASAGALSAALTAAPTAPRATIPTAVASADGRTATRGRWPLAAGLLAALSLALAGALLVVARRPRDTRVIRAALQVDPRSGPYPQVVAASPDGRSYLHCTSAGLVELRRWDDLAATTVPGFTTGCVSAAYSPDGTSLAIVGIPTSLHVVALEAGGPPRRLIVEGLDDVAVYGGLLDWGSDDRLYLAGRRGLLRISPATGQAERIAIADSARVLVAVDVLPGATHAVLVTTTAAGTDYSVGFLDLEGGVVTPVSEGVMGRFVAPDRVLVVRQNGSMMSLPIDPRTGRTTGPSVSVPDSLGAITAGPAEQGRLHVGADGTLLYWRSEQNGETRPVLVDREGGERPLPESWTARQLIPRFSPDGTRFAVEVFGPDSRTVVRTLANGATRTAGTPGSLTGRPTWTPDGSGLTLIADRDGLARPYAWRLSGDELAPLPLYDPRPVFATEWSRDGRWLLLRTDDNAPGKADILALQPDVDSVARPLLASPDVAEYSPMLSPDGRWLAYVSNEDGRYEVRVTAFPEVRERWRISTQGGSEPAWSHDGRELYYFADDGYMMRATVTAGTEFAVSSQERLFPIDPYVRYGFFNRNYDVRRDGTFLMLRNTGSSTSSLVAVHGWAADLRSSAAR